MAIDKLNLTFAPEQVLNAEDMNKITKKTDELVAGQNSSIVSEQVLSKDIATIIEELNEP